MSDNNVQKLDVVYECDELIAINKPHGLLVHRTPLAADADEFALQILRDQIGLRIYPVHRLDRKTSGVLLFAKSQATNSALQQLFRERKVVKSYLAIVRGFIDPSGIINYPLRNETKTQEAQTAFTRSEKFELDIPSGKFNTSRYSSVELKPITGRHHQLRKHLAHIFHPIIGDRPHGCNKQNRIWKERFGLTEMLLHAGSLSFEFPSSNPVVIVAPRSEPFERSLNMLRQQNQIEV